MQPTPEERIGEAVAASPLLAKYVTTAVPAGTANEVLAQQASEAQARAAEAEQAAASAREYEAMQKQAVRDAERRSRAEVAARKRREREAAAETRRREREAERLRKQTVNAGVKVARVILGKLFGRSR
jgi:hypothetical protein